VRSFVLGDKALAKHAGRYVWLSVDIDQDANAPFLTKYPVPGIPTFLVIDPATEKVVLTRSAGPDRAQFEAMFDAGERALKRTKMDPADAAFDEGEELSGAGKPKEAVAALQRALQAAPKDWPRHRAAVEALTLALDQSDQPRACAELAARETVSGPRDVYWANLVNGALACASEANTVTPELIQRGKDALAVASGDDKSSLYESLFEATHDKQIAEAWLGFLEGEAQKAKTPAERAVYDPHRLAAAIAVGDPGRAVPALKASERDLPEDYNAPARLAIAYLEMGRYDDGLAASERALKKVYGPRRLRVEETRATLYQRKGDTAAAMKVLDEAIRFGESLPPSPRSQAAVARLRKLLEAAGH
jgi:tetratricopeptide (TPR) repeat protein